MSPAPLLQALQIAQRTRRIKIVTAALVLPIWQPLRLAEEVAVLDNLTGGRLICGVGRGYQSHEFGRFGVAAEESRGRFDECLHLLVKAWTSVESFTYQGRYIQVPEPVVVWPKPLQRPHPPLWIVGASEVSIRLAAERDLVLLTSGFAGPAAVRETAAAWVRARCAAEKPLDGLEMGVQTMTHVADSDAAARTAGRYARWQNRANRALQRRAVKNGAVEVGPYEGERSEAEFFDSLYFGTPDVVIEKFRRLAAVGATIVSTWMMLGDIEHQKIMRSLALMGQEVIPALRDLDPPAELASILASALPTDQPPVSTELPPT
jgi:alkanesulfonate monooxygenase SsuD/methylene tetrahydromethanopterin reductase-like flavin-dependent oxidoreductase (luciferase family)